MKTFLALLISCLTLSAATTYPVLTDSANRLFPGGVTNVFFLNSNVVTTGTMRATGAVTLTNSGNVFAGDGSGLTGAGIATTGGSATNLQIYSSGTTNQPFRAWLGTQTNSNPVEISGIWNNASVDFSALKVNVTNTASGSASKIADFQVDGSSKVSLDKDGHINLSGGAVKLSAIQAQSAFVIEQVAAPSFSRLYGVAEIWLQGKSSGTTPYIVFTQYGASHDLGIARNSSGVLEINSSSLNALRDLLARSVYATNLYATNLIINGGATVTKILSATATLNFDLTALTVEDLTITVTGAADGDVVTLGVPNGSVTTSVQYSAWVSASDTVTVRARTSATGENPASGTFRATIFRH